MPDVTIFIVSSCILDRIEYSYAGHSDPTLNGSSTTKVCCPRGKIKVGLQSFAYFGYLCFVWLRCAFVNFKDRASAERAAEAWANGLDVDGERIAVKWGRSRPLATAAFKPPSMEAPVAS
jgi:hypothetical protein